MAAPSEATAQRSLLTVALAAFPRGGLLPDANWRRRHLAWRFRE